jgi:hypothetical protein
MGLGRVQVHYVHEINQMNVEVHYVYEVNQMNMGVHYVHLVNQYEHNVLADIPFVIYTGMSPTLDLLVFNLVYQLNHRHSIGRSLPLKLVYSQACSLSLTLLSTSSKPARPTSPHSVWKT